MLSYSKLFCFSLFLFCCCSYRWLNGLFSKGYDRRLEPADIYEVLQEDSAQKLVADLERLEIYLLIHVDFFV